MDIIWEIVPLMITIIAIISLLIEERTIKIILRVICFVATVLAIIFSSYQRKLIAEEHGINNIRSDALKSNDGERNYVIQQNTIINDTLWDITVKEETAYSPVQTTAYYLIKGETVFLFNERGINQNYAMTITLTPWTIEDIEKMDGIEITDYIE